MTWRQRLYRFLAKRGWRDPKLIGHKRSCEFPPGFSETWPGTDTTCTFDIQTFDTGQTIRQYEFCRWSPEDTLVFGAIVSCPEHLFDRESPALAGIIDKDLEAGLDVQRRKTFKLLDPDDV